MAWQRVAVTTISNYFKGAEPAILRNKKILAALQKKGRVSMNVSGSSVTWDVEYRRSALNAIGDMEEANFSRLNRWQQATLPWRMYTSTDAWSQQELLMNRGQQAIVDLADKTGKRLQEDIKQNFQTEMWIDGYATGNEKRIHGLESFFGHSTTSTLKVALPNDTYGGLNTNFADKGGSWTGTWPSGSGDFEYDYWAPLMANYNTGEDYPTGWTSSTAGWAQNASEILDFMIVHTQKNTDIDSQPDMFTLDRDMYLILMANLSDKQRIAVDRGRAGSLLVSLGFNDVINVDGVDITWEYGVPASSGYMMNIKKMELMSQESQLFKVVGPEYSIRTDSWLIRVNFYGNLRVDSPRFFGKIGDFST